MKAKIAGDSSTVVITKFVINLHKYVKVRAANLPLYEFCL